MASQRIKLYQGIATPCSYLDNRDAINIYADPHHPNPKAVYNQLITKGFRRSGEYVYRPGCGECKACIPVRVKCEGFRSRRTDRRNLSVNADLEVSYTIAEYSDEYFNLYSRYLAARHADGGMDNPQPEDFRRFLLNPWAEVLFVTARLNKQIIAVAVTDAIPDGLSAVYTFFDPELSARGLGRFCILQQIELCRSMNMPHLYLGYWIDGCQKMQYKTDYQPQEHYDGQQWTQIK